LTFCLFSYHVEAFGFRALMYGGKRGRERETGEERQGKRGIERETGEERLGKRGMG